MEKTPHSHYTIRFSDCDPFGHLNNARYIDYFLNAREDHLKTAYQMDLKSFYQQGLTWFVGSHEIAYLKPADYNESVMISTSLIDAAPDSLLVEMVMTDQQRSHLKALMHTRFIPVSLKSGKRENHPQDFMQFAQSVAKPLQDQPFSERVREIALSLKATKV
jgi:YbgC/YbaW family acyl-CoA thioester hydrolase